MFLFLHNHYKINLVHLYIFFKFNIHCKESLVYEFISCLNVMSHAIMYLTDASLTAMLRFLGKKDVIKA